MTRWTLKRDVGVNLDCDTMSMKHTKGWGGGYYGYKPQKDRGMRRVPLCLCAQLDQNRALASWEDSIMGTHKHVVHTCRSRDWVENTQEHNVGMHVHWNHVTEDTGIRLYIDTCTPHCSFLYQHAPFHGLEGSGWDKEW